MSLIEFWDGATLDVDLRSVVSTAIPVKGKLYNNPCRMLEIYGNANNSASSTQHKATMRMYSDAEIRTVFLPKIPNVTLQLSEDTYQPPFIWSDCTPAAIATNFTYTTNAIYRILSNLYEADVLPHPQISHLLDEVCLLLTRIYKSNGYSMIKYINNNLNMFIISKAIEVLLGKNIYDVERQETELTDKALIIALAMAEGHIGLSPKQQMALALGKGIAFVERYARSSYLSKDVFQTISETSYKYTESGIAIDDRDKLINMLDDAKEHSKNVVMCAILDDTAESVDDLLWMQQLMVLFPCFHVNLVVNTAQVSINFSIHMLDTVLQAYHFRNLAIRVGSQLTVTKTYCPLISLQNNLLDFAAKKAIRDADFVFVKGLNFFETCQVMEKDAFHSFVVYGPISRTYTGLPDFSGVFAFLPAGFAGFKHSKDPSKLDTLKVVWRKINKIPSSTGPR